MSNENVRVNINAETKGVNEAKAQIDALNKGITTLIQNLKHLGASNSGLQSLSSGLDKLSTKLHSQTKAGQEAAKAAQRHSAAMQQLAKSSQRLEAALTGTKKASTGGIFGPGAKINIDTKAGERALADWQKRTEVAGRAFLGNPKNLDSAKRNFEDVRKSVRDVNATGVATKGTYNALSTGISAGFARSLTSTEQFRLRMHVMKKDVESLVLTYQNHAKNLQWTGRQLIVGLSAPIALFAQQATYAFMDVEREFFQLQKVTEFGKYAEEGADKYYDKLKTSIRELSTSFAIEGKKMTNLFREIAALGIDSASNIEKWAEGISQLSVLGDMPVEQAMAFFRSLNAIFQGGNMDPTATIDNMAQLNAIADETSLQLSDLAAAFPEVAPVMKSMGADAAAVAGSLAAMFKRGIPATEGAHALKFSLQSLITPTRDAEKIISDLGISFFDSQGNITDFDQNIMAAALAIKGLTAESELNVAGELFGKRQTARMNSYFEDVAQGVMQIKAATEDGIMSLQEAQALTSDWARSLVAAGKIEVEGLDSAAARYENAMNMMRENPAFMWDQLRVRFKQIMTDIGAIITPPLLDLGDKVLGLLEKFMALPAGIKKVIATIGAAVVSLGPFIFIFAQMQLAVTTFAETFLKASNLLGRFRGIKDILPEDAERLFKRDRNRRDIYQSHGVFYQDKSMGKKVRQRFGADASLVGASDDMYKIAAASKVADESLEEMGEQGVKSGAQIAAGSKVAEEAVESLNRKIRAINAEQKAMNTFLAGTGMTDALGEAMDAKYAQKAAKAMDEASDVIDDAGDMAKRKSTAAAGWGSLFGFTFVDKISSALKKGKAKVGTALKFLFGGAGKAMKGLGGTAIIGGAIDQFKGAQVANATGFSKVLNSIKGGLKGLAFGGLSAGKSMMGLLLVFGKLTIVIGVIIAVIIILIKFIQGIKDNWNTMKDNIEPAMESLRNSIAKLKDAFAYIGEKFKEVFNTLSGGGEGDSSAPTTFWENIADVIAGFIDFLAKAISVIADIIKWLWPVFEGIAYVVRNVIGFVVSLFQGDWANAFLFFAAIAWEGIRPVMLALELLVDGFLWAIQGIIRIVGWGVAQIANILAAGANAIAQVINTIAGWFGMTPNLSAEGWGDAVTGWVDSIIGGIQGVRDFGIVDWFDDTLRDNMPTVFERGVGDGAEEGIEEGLDDNPQNEQVAEDAGEQLGEDMGDAMKDAAKEGAEDAAQEWFKDFLSAVKSNLNTQMQDLRDAAIEALEQSFEAQIAVFDARLDALDAQEEAERKLYATQEYLEKKRELLYRRSLSVQNYQRDRALAIYEGRIDDARMLDLEHEKNTHDFNRDLGEIEEDRRRELVDEAREAERERINDAKEAALERQELEKEAFEEQLDIILKYAPRNIEEYNKMLSSINGLLHQYGVVGWPEMAKTGGERFMEAIKNANEDIRQEFAWGGEAAITAWIAAFVDPDVAAILASKLAGASAATPSAPSGGAAPSGGPGAGGGAPAMPETPAPGGGGDESLLDQLGLGGGNAAEVDMGWWDQVQEDFWNGIEAIKQWFGGIPEWLGGVWENIEEIAGNALSGLVDIISNILDPIIGTFQDILDPIVGTFQDIWGEITDVVSGAWDTIGNVISGAWNFVIKPIWDAISGTISNVIVPIFQFLWRIVQQVWDAISSAISIAWTNVIKPVWDFIAYNLENRIFPIFEFFGSIVQAVFNLISFAIQIAWETVIKPIWDAIYGFITETLMPNFWNLGALVGTVWNAISGAISWAWENVIKPVWDFIWNAIANVLVPLFQNLWGIVVQVWDGISAAISWAWETIIRPVWDAIWAAIADNLIPWLQSLWEKAREIWDAISGKIQDAWNNYVSPVFNAVRDFIRDTLMPIWDDLKNKIETVWNWLGEFLKTAWDGVVGAIKTVLNSIIGALETGINWIIGGWNDMINFWNSLPDWVHEDVSLVQPVSFNRFHTGGIVPGRGETIAILQGGEGVLPVNVMNKLGPEVFEALRSGVKRNVSPGVGSVKMSDKATAVVSGGGGEYNIYVDTFVGEEQWFKQMADKYDMKINLKRAKSSGSQKRVISNYNQNNRGSF